MVERVRLDGPVELELPDGGVVRVQPGPYRRGISMVPVSEGQANKQSNGKRGRRPRTGTLKLRERLQKDLKTGRIAEAAVYVRWLLQKDPSISVPVARQVVYRERRAVLNS